MLIDVTRRRTGADVTQTVAGAGGGRPASSPAGRRSAGVPVDRSVRRPDPHGRRHTWRDGRPVEHRVATCQTISRHKTATITLGGPLQTQADHVGRRRLSADAGHDARRQTAHRRVVVAVFGWQRAHHARRPAQPFPLPSQSVVDRATQPDNAPAPPPGPDGGRFGRLLENARRPVADYDGRWP